MRKPKLKCRGGWYSIRYRERQQDGSYKEVVKALGTQDRAVAESVLQDRIRTEARWALGGGREVADPPTIDEVFAQYTSRYVSFLSAGSQDRWKSVSTLTLKYLRGVRVDRLDLQDFRPIQQTYLSRGLTRKYVNGQIQQIKIAFKWAAQEGIVSSEDYQRVAMFPALKLGRTDAREGEPITAVDRAVTLRTAAVIGEPYSTIIRLLWHTGARSGEICALDARWLDMTGKVWRYRPKAHKTAHKGVNRLIVFGPDAQALLRPFLPAALGRGRFFVTPTRGKPFTQIDMGRLVKSTNDAHGIPAWTLHQIRHSVSLEITRAHGIEKARDFLGHSDIKTTLGYNDRMVEEMERIVLDRK